MRPAAPLIEPAPALTQALVLIETPRPGAPAPKTSPRTWFPQGASVSQPGAWIPVYREAQQQLQALRDGLAALRHDLEARKAELEARKTAPAARPFGSSPEQAAASLEMVFRQAPQEWEIRLRRQYEHQYDNAIKPTLDGARAIVNAGETGAAITVDAAWWGRYQDFLAACADTWVREAAAGVYKRTLEENAAPFKILAEVNPDPDRTLLARPNFACEHPPLERPEITQALPQFWSSLWGSFRTSMGAVMMLVGLASALGGVLATSAGLRPVLLIGGLVPALLWALYSARENTAQAWRRIEAGADAKIRAELDRLSRDYLATTQKKLLDHVRDYFSEARRSFLRWKSGEFAAQVEAREHARAGEAREAITAGAKIQMELTQLNLAQTQAENTLTGLAQRLAVLQEMAKVSA